MIHMPSSKLHVESAVAAMAKYGEELCGDTVRNTRTSNSLISVLSDGLGSGVKASILSTLTASIASEMLRFGASLEDMMETIGKTLPVCQVRKIAYATIGAIEIEDTGQAFVAEFDTPPIILLRDGRPVRVERTVRGVGRGDQTVREAHFWVQRGDFLISVSDGVIHAGIGARLRLGLGMEGLESFLEGVIEPEMSSQRLATTILDHCRYLYDGKPGDDTTVCVAKVRTPRRLIVAVGPPKDRKLDREFAMHVSRFPGARAVCGGTTANVIADQLDREIKVDLADVIPGHPPKGRIQGIDFVGEGIVTLCGVLKHLKGEADDETSPAAELAEMILHSDSIRFNVGRAINPAHQNPELPFDMTLKQQVVGKIHEILEAQGKTVEAVYF